MKICSCPCECLFSLYWFSPSLCETWCYQTTSINETRFHNKENIIQNFDNYSTTLTFKGKMACHPVKGTTVSTGRENIVPQSAFTLKSAPATAETLHLLGHVLRVNRNIMTTTSLHNKFKLGNLSVCQYVLLMPFHWKRNTKVIYHYNTSVHIKNICMCIGMQM